MQLEGIPFQSIGWSRVEPADGRRITLRTGDRHVVAGGAHRSSSPGGARLFIAD